MIVIIGVVSTALEMRGTNNQRHSANPKHTQTAFLFIQLHTNLQYV